MPYVGEIKLVGFDFAPPGWLFCHGQELSISENEVLFQLIGTTYGGDGETTFALPDLRSRVPIHVGTGSFGVTYILGEMGGAEQVTLTVDQIPAHTHNLNVVADPGTTSQPVAAYPAQSTEDLGRVYRNTGTEAFMTNQGVATMGRGEPHENRQPYQVLNFMISLTGVFPSPT